MGNDVNPTKARATFGMCCGYCEKEVEGTFCSDDELAKRAHKLGWRMTWGISPRWGDGAHYTCKDCQTPGEEKTRFWWPAGRAALNTGASDD
jgi:hypothetical protein